MASSLNDKVVIVTGSSSGLGEAIALAFASRGAKVTLCGRDQDRLRSVFDKLVEISGGKKDRFLTVQGDLNDSVTRKEIIAKTVEKFGRLDILVPSAGLTSAQTSISNATEESYDSVMNTNLKSVFFLIQEAVPHLEKSKGNIVNISSHVTTMILPIGAVYCMSKAALDHLTRCLAVDLGQKGIRVNSVNPGYIPTRILRMFGDAVDRINQQFAKVNTEKVPLKGRDLTAGDIAEVVTFLSSDAAGFITGDIVTVDGGRGYCGGM